MKRQKNGKNVNQTLKNLFPIIVFVVVIFVLTLIFLPEIKRLATDDGREAFKEWVDGLGFWGWLAALGIQLLQIFVAFIPGEPVELLLGYVFGSWLGTATCLLGIFIGTLVIFLLVRRLGMPFVTRAVGTDDLTKYKFLSSPKKVELTVFVLFFIPGTPKDALTYIAPIAPITPVKYLSITTFARIPSVITSTLLGDSIAEGNYTLAIIVFVITALISLVGIFFGNKFVEKKSEDGKT